MASRFFEKPLFTSTADVGNLTANRTNLGIRELAIDGHQQTQILMQEKSHNASAAQMIFNLISEKFLAGSFWYLRLSCYEVTKLKQYKGSWHFSTKPVDNFVDET